MPMNVIQGALIPNHYGHVGGDQRTDAQAAINAIQYADIFGGPGMIANHGTMRVDNQGHFQVGGVDPYYYNIQVQVNGVHGNSTVAHANVCDTIMTNDPLNQTGAKNRVISALQRSLDDDHSYTVTGTCP